MKEITYEELLKMPKDSFELVDIRDEGLVLYGMIPGAVNISLEELEFVEANIFKSVENVNLSTIVAYKKDGVRHSFLDEY
ncbi:rhodanese-like domain-containing protein [Butyrivibrio sp. AC2005]|uniref:rhodanese-like domain-containing protein n=1 Tax=Butyrivibrio sp. AC2005 TaxID=1280672 RepID=UPI00042998A1|nr:rhodanese-like domain-containing protein [Butyrivibrio sp. AC2005]